MNGYLVLLRGINVGGKNIIKMTDLKASFEEMGFSNVVTYMWSPTFKAEMSSFNRKIRIKL